MPGSGTPKADSTASSGIDRRQLLGALGATATIGLAGCPGGGDGDGSGDGSGSGSGTGSGGEPGERVQTIPIPYWSNVGGDTQLVEGIYEVIAENLTSLGLDVEAKPTEFTTQVSNIIADERTSPLPMMYYTSPSERLDTQQQLGKFDITRAGGPDGNNMAQYASCTYTRQARQSSSAGSDEERLELANEAWSTFSEDLTSIPIVNRDEYGVVDTTAVDLQNVGEAGVSEQNAYMLIESSPTEGDALVFNTVPVTLETTNFNTLDSPPALAAWNHLVHSPLVQFDHNYELQNVLAESYEVRDDGTTIHVELTDATFHNGDPVTASDVKFTFEHIYDNPGSFPKSRDIPLTGVTVVDESTVEFEFEEPYLAFIRTIMAMWGILHEQTWVDAGAPESPGDVEIEDMVGSGPFELQDIAEGQSMSLLPFGDHPVFDAQSQVLVQAFRSQQTARQSFEAGELQFLTGATPNQANQLAEQDGYESYTRSGFMPYLLWPQQNFGPTKFRPFRQAVGMALDRQTVNEVVFYGQTSPLTYSSFLGGNHPLFDESVLTQFTDDPTGDVEGARQVLSEAGWTWDDQDRLCYPSDADLDPLWPQGEPPAPADYPCLTGDGEYTGDF